MGVFIADMEMPKNGETITITICDDGIVFTEWKEPGSVFKAVPVPPHADLIDRNEFVKEECNHCDGACEKMPCNCLNCREDCRCDLILDLMDAPVIIPAEEETT